MDDLPASAQAALTERLASVRIACDARGRFYTLQNEATCEAPGHAEAAEQERARIEAEVRLGRWDPERSQRVDWE